MTYCAYCGAKMQETADVCPVCGKWKRQVGTPGGRATVREPAETEKTRVYTGATSRYTGIDADQARAQAAEQARAQAAAQARAQAAAQARAQAAAQARAQAPTQTRTQPSAQARAQSSTQTRAQSSPARQARPAASANVSPARQQIQSHGAGFRQADARTQPGTRAQEREVSVHVKETVSAAADTVKTRVQTAGRDVSGALRRVQIPKSRLYAALGFVAALVLVIVISASIASGSGAHGVTKKLARAYEHQNAAEMMALGGALMQALYPDTELEAECRNNIDVVRDTFSDRLGSRYRFSYEITLGKTYKGDELQTRLESTYGDLGGDFDLSRVQAMTTATLTLQARHSGAKAEKRIAVTLVKENGKWKLASQLV